MTTASAENISSRKHRSRRQITNFFSKPVLEVTFFFSIAFLLACPLAAIYTGETTEVFSGFFKLLTSPSPLITDYYNLGNLPATFLNAGVCGMTFSLMMLILKTDCQTSNWAGFFLVIAHCFYGLNFINMWPPVVGILLYSKVNKINFRDNIDIAMFSTAFAPFISELIYRYPLSKQLVIPIGEYGFSLIGLGFSLLLSIFLGFAVPAMLPGALKLHRGYNLYNGGLAFGLLGLLIYSWLFQTMSHTPEGPVQVKNAIYDMHDHSYMLFCNIFFIAVFTCCILTGWFRNGRSFFGFNHLMTDSGHRADFINEYGMGCTWINLGFYGLFMLLFFDLVILFTDGAGFTGPPCGVLLAALSFAASGQHIKIVWPVLLGFVILYLVALAITSIGGTELQWSLSTQQYINGAGFATGLCPFTGKYGKRVGCMAGIISAIICTTTVAMHGGYMLYNGGLTTGITALILTPMLDHYYLQHKDKSILNRIRKRKNKE